MKEDRIKIMGSRSPSKIRREGREAFEPNLSIGEIRELNPYINKKGLYAAYEAEDWLDGWLEAQTAWELEEKTKTEETFCPYCGHEVTE